MSTRLFRILSAISGIAGVIMLIASFSINPGPPSNATSAQLTAFGNQYYTSILWGAWLQAVGPLLNVLFAFAIVCLAGATTRLAGSASSLPAAGSRHSRLTCAPTGVRVPGTGAGSRLCDLRSCLPLHPHLTCGGLSFCGSPDALVVGCRHHVYRPYGKDI